MHSLPPAQWGGKTVSLYSAATSADVNGTINITPFTDLIIRNIAATAVDTYINSGGFSGLTTAQLDAQRDALTNALSPALIAMGLPGSIDLLRATFNADSTGLDRFMDVVKVDTTTPSAVTITNILDAANTLIIDTTASSTTLATSGTLGTTGLAASGTPLDGMLATANAFSAFFATSLPDPANTNLLALFSNTFLEDGRNSSAFLTEITTSGPSIIGLKFINVVVDSVDTATGIAQIHFTPVNAAGVSLAHDQYGGAMAWQMKLDAVSGIWQLDGNQRIARVSVKTNASHNICNPSLSGCNWASSYSTGLSLEINNKGLQPIGSAVVTGPGLAVPVTLAMPANQTWFNISTTNANNNCQCGNNWNMTDQEIALVLPNSVYTVQLWSNALTPTLLATYTEVVPVAPVTNAVVQTLAYPTITGMVSLAGKGAFNVPLSWNIPAGLWGDWLSVNVWQNVTNENLNVGADAMTATGTATLAITAPTNAGTWSSGNYWINAWDQYGGKVNTDYQ